MAARRGSGPEAEKQRRALREATRLKVYEFNAHGVELNHRYDSAAVLTDHPDSGLRTDPLHAAAAPELEHLACTTPGARLPHTWLTVGGHEVSTLDLAGHGRFVLLTGLGGEAWEQAAAAVSEAIGVEVAVEIIGPGRRVDDPYGDWAAAREADGICDTGAVLARPDHHVCWRVAELPGDPTAALSDALTGVLAR